LKYSRIVFTPFIGWYISIILLIVPSVQSASLDATNSAESAYVQKTVVGFDYIKSQRFIANDAIFQEGWNNLAQPEFWRKVINLHHDSAIINIAEIRKPIHTISTEQWGCQEEPEKDEYKVNLCRSLKLEEDERLYVTSGKKFFFEYKKVIPFVSRSIDVFEETGVDPWYAQSILVIESPGKTNARSYVGARGPFQLMPYVARKYGLTVTRNHDDRTDLEKSAKAAAQLLNGICIPKAKELLDTLRVSYTESDLWFRLVVLHIYHAGYSNVACAIRQIDPSEGGMELIQELWQTECRGFKNESQNYSQIALASLIEFDSIINLHPDTIFMVSGDRFRNTTDVSSLSGMALLDYYSKLRAFYQDDLVNGVIPAAYFISKSREIENHIALIDHINSSQTTQAESADRMYELGNELIRKQKFEEAIEILKEGIESDPNAYHVYDSLGRAYKLMGDEDMAKKYTLESEKIQSAKGFN
jgi:tetratricopeptide (TPR) repeat protein